MKHHTTPGIMRAVRGVAHEDHPTIATYAAAHAITVQAAHHQYQAALKNGYLTRRPVPTGRGIHYVYKTTAIGARLVEAARPETMIDVVSAVLHHGLTTTKSYQYDTGISSSSVWVRYLTAERLGYLLFDHRLISTGGREKVYRVTKLGKELVT